MGRPRKYDLETRVMLGMEKLPAPDQKPPKPAQPFTQALQDRFIEIYATGNYTVRQIGEIIGVSHVTIFNKRADDPAFKARYQAAQERVTDVAEDRIAERVMDLKRDDSLRATGMWVRAFRPDRWNPAQNIDISNKDGSFGAFATGMALARGELKLTDDESRSTH